MAPVMCPLDIGHEDVEVLEVLPDGRQKARCPDCDYAWVHGEARPASPGTAEPTPRPMPTADKASPEAMARAERLKPVFLSQEHAGLDPRVPTFWAKYQHIFSEEGLPAAGPADLRAFGKDTSGSNLGIQATFRSAFDENPEYGAAQVRQVVDYLLRGTGKPLEDRLTDLINGKLRFSFPGFKELLLSKVLSVVYPKRFLTLLTYEQKTIAAKDVYGLDLPPYDRARIGHQIVRSNDLLAELTGDGFIHRPHAGEFLWWAQRQPYVVRN
jgi:hypothetical protein